MYDPVETIELINGGKVEIHYDTEPYSPREHDNICTMVCWHRRYNLGDEQPSADPQEYFSTPCEDCEGTGYGNHEDGERSYWGDPKGSHDCPTCKGAGYITMDPVEFFKKEFGATTALPLYLYDHSGISISTGAFSCKWDSGQVGWIFDGKEGRDMCWGKDQSTYNEERAIEIMKCEVEEYDNYLRGNVYGYVIEDAQGNTVESCWGFYPDMQKPGEPYQEPWKYCLEEALSNAEAIFKLSTIEQNPTILNLVVC